MNNPPSTAEVIANLEKFVGWEPDGSPRLVAMREAVAALRRLAPPRDADEMKEYQAHGYRIDSHAPTREVRLSIFRKSGQRDLLGYIVMNTPEVYDLGSALIKNFDKLEGV